MKDLESVVNDYRKRIESYVTGTSSPGISYDESGNKYWKGKKLVDCWGWSHARHLKNWEKTLKFMPNYFEYGPLNTRTNLYYHPELTEMFENWLHDYYDYLLFIGDTTEVRELMWKEISK